MGKETEKVKRNDHFGTKKVWVIAGPKAKLERVVDGRRKDEAWRKRDKFEELNEKD